MHAMTKNHGLIISSLPIVQSGLLAIMKDYFPEYVVNVHSQPEVLTSVQLCNATLAMVELSCNPSLRKPLCAMYYSLMVQYPHIRWVFMVNSSIYPLAIEYLLRPESTLLSDAEPIHRVISAIQQSEVQRVNLSPVLLSPDAFMTEMALHDKTALTFSERKVLRLLAKGWAVNQIAVLLNKSNKTVSAQKNSAMRRLALRGNAEMFAWMNSVQGMRELNLQAKWEETKQWKSAPQQDMSLS